MLQHREQPHIGPSDRRRAIAVELWVSKALGLKLWVSSTYMFSRIPSTMNWGYAFWIVLFAVTAAIVGTLIPAIVAARIQPVKILRYE